MCIKPKDTYDEPFAEFDEQEKRDALGKGLFWLVQNDEEKFELFCVKMHFCCVFTQITSCYSWISI